MKTFKTTLLTTTMLLCSTSLLAQDDFTHYIANAGFDEDLTFTTDGQFKEGTAPNDATPTLSGRSWSYVHPDGSCYAYTDSRSTNWNGSDGRSWATNGYVAQIKGWECTRTDYPKCEWVYFGVLPYDLAEKAIPVADDGTTFQFVPAKPDFANGDDNKGALFCKAAWDGRCSYKQVVKLPSAVYRLEYWTINVNSNSTANTEDLTNVKCDGRVYKDISNTSFASEEWTKHHIEFTVNSMVTECTIEIGYKAASSGSSGQVIVFIDEIKLYRLSPIESDDVDVDGVIYKLNNVDNTASVIWCDNRTDVVIPENFVYAGNFYTVTEIENNAFKNTPLMSVSIPNGITSIDPTAFSSCSGLTSVTFNCKNVGTWFRGKESIKKVTFGDGVTSISDYAFEGCSGLNNVTIGNNVTSIGEGVFSDCPLKSLTIGSGVLSIGSNQSPSVKTIWLTNTPPSGYENLQGKINYVANDQYNGLSNVQVYPYISSVFETGGVKYVPVSPAERTCDAIDCNYDSTFVDINIGENVSYRGVEMKVHNVMPYIAHGHKFVKGINLSSKGNVGQYAFYGCTGITDATISNEGNIGESAFEGAMTYGNAVLKISNKGDIGDKAFYGCKGIADATISNEGNIGNNAFYGAMTSRNAVLKVSNKGYIGQSAFYGCTGIIDATISNEGNIGDAAFYGCTALKTVDIKNKGCVGSKAFNGCASLKTATLGDKVTSLGAYDFSGCSSLQGFVIPNSVESIGAYAFSGCSAMKSVKMGSGVTKIDNYTFQDCSALTDMNIGSNVETIGTYVFSGCSALQEIVIPQATTSIGNYAFSGCHSLADVIIKDRTETLSLGSNGSSPLFASCPLDSVYIGGKITYGTSSSNGYSPFYRNTALRTVVITDKETEIYANEFYGCTNLKNVSIGSNVKKIGNWAFSGCSNLDYFSFGKSVESIGEEAFSDCVNMTQLISYAVTPPTCGTQALDDINKWNCTLKIPEGTNSAYMAADQWKEFFFIENVPNAINGVVVDGDDADKNAPVYNLQGMKMQNADNLPAGIYIKGGKKYIIK